MIYSLRGTLLGKTSTYAVLEAAGVGYLLGMSTHSLSALPAIGEKAFLLTVMSVRESDISLYGFVTEEERDLFERLVGVSGIGPKVALSALSSFAPSVLSQVILAGDTVRIATIPGIGKKTAQRIVLELKGSLENPRGEAGLFDQLPSEEASPSTSAFEALGAMGFSVKEAESALQGYSGDTTDISDIMRYALKRLGSNL